MSTYLRLHTEPPTSSATDDAPVTYKFPVSMAAARRTLVAGTVNVPAIPEELTGRKTRRDVICRIDASGPGRDCMTSTDSLISNVEATLVKMQESLDRLNADVEEECESYKFPELFEEGPRAA